MSKWSGSALLVLLLALPAAAQTSPPLTKIVFGTDWMAEAEHGGYYQAVAMGFYKKHGLDVTIKMGGPRPTRHRPSPQGSSTSRCPPAASARST